MSRFPPAHGVRSALFVSVASLVWTVLVGVSACIAGVTTDSLALVAFGAIGLLDAGGSAMLVVHFRHWLSHEAVSQRLERVALRFVTTGMLLIGVATIAVSVYRLITHAKSDSSAVGAVLAGAAFLSLAAFAILKRKLARKTGSQALLADGWVSAMGSLLAMVALASAALSAVFHWSWVDPLAATVIACAAVAMSFALRREAEAGTS